jgi:hypothetical protein
MKRCLITVALICVLLLPRLYAVQNQNQYQTGKIVDVQQKARTRILYYVVNTPVTKDDPYFEVSVQLKDTIYVGEYTPLHASETLPEDWRVDASVSARVDKHHLFLKRPEGMELQFVIVKRIASEPAQKAAEPVPAKN